METIIVLAVTSGLFVSAMIMMSGQQAKTEFSQSIGDARSGMDDVVNDVATGYFMSRGGVTCGNLIGAPFIWGNGTQEQGTYQACMMVGKAVQLGIDTDASKYNVFNIVGLRLAPSTGQQPVSLSQAVVDLSSATGTVDNRMLSGGLKIYSAFYQDQVGGAKIPVSGFAVVSSLAKYSTSGTLQAGSTSVDLIPLTNTGGKESEANFRTNAKTLLRGTSPLPILNPSGGITVCMDSGGTDQHVLLTIGVNGNLSTDSSVKQGKSADDVGCKP